VGAVLVISSAVGETAPCSSDPVLDGSIDYVLTTQSTWVTMKNVGLAAAAAAAEVVGIATVTTVAHRAVAVVDAAVAVTTSPRVAFRCCAATCRATCGTWRAWGVGDGAGGGFDW
jgi:hypothetical protein